MRTQPTPLVAACLALALASPSALAGGKGDDDVLGTYDVRYEEVSSSCTTTSIALTRGELVIGTKKTRLLVDIPRLPPMQGSPAKNGRVRATSKLDRTPIDGLDGKFSVAGRAEDDVLTLVLVGEYYVQGRPLCSQTWNVSGQRKARASGGKGKRKRSADAGGDATDAPAVIVAGFVGTPAPAALPLR